MEFNGEVVLVTGSSRGLGRAFAEFLAAAGAQVGVNSTGESDDGELVVRKIVSAGGRAVHLPGLVEDADSLVEAVVREFGQINAIVHNAGFVRDKTLRNMSMDQWDAVLNVHLKAAFALTHAAWPHFEAVGGGRLVFISSASGLYGNFGQGNYAAAKAGMYGLARTITLEGHDANIKCNVVAPFGATELNSANMPEPLKALIKPAFIAPLVGYLAHSECKASGGLFEASGGVFKKVRWQRSEGLALDIDTPMSLADIADGWHLINDFSSAEYPPDMRSSLRGMYERKPVQDATD